MAKLNEKLAAAAMDSLLHTYVSPMFNMPLFNTLTGKAKEKPVPDTEKIELTKEEVGQVARNLPAGTPIQKKFEDAYRAIVVREQRESLGTSWERAADCDRLVTIRGVRAWHNKDGNSLQDHGVWFPNKETADLFFQAKRMAHVLDLILKEDQDRVMADPNAETISQVAYEEALHVLKLAGWERMG
jgi:hypothetical protein